MEKYFIKTLAKSKKTFTRIVNKRKILFLTPTLISFFTYNCQVPYEFENPEALSNIPVVQGILTNTDGPHSVRLTYARPYNTNQNENIEGANVWIGEVNGDSVRMEDMGKGDYTIAKGVFYPKTGREYKLTIHLPDGSVIHSVPSLMPDTIAIDEIYFQRNNNLEPPGYTPDGSKPDPGVTVKMLLSNTNNGKVFYRIQGEYIYFVKQVHIKSRILFEFLPDGTKMPFATLESITIDSCYSLYQYKDQHRIGQLNRDVQYNRSDLSFSVSLNRPSFDTTEIPASTWSELNWPSEKPTKSPVLKWFNYAKVYQISASAYQYYKAQLDQINAPQRIFDPIPYQIQSNLHFVGETSRPVLGFFDVCAVNQRIYEVTPFIFEYNCFYQAELSNDSHPFLGCRTTQLDSIFPFVF